MSDYADTGFLCSLYCPDAHTGKAAGVVERQQEPVFFTWLNRVELRNALRLRVFRGEITPAQRDSSIAFLQSDLVAGVLASVDPPHEDMLLETERLSAGFSGKLGTRSLDVLHVAMAVVLGSRRFLSFDLRQGRLARAAGLKVPRGLMRA